MIRGAAQIAGVVEHMGRASSTVQFRYTEVGIQTFLRTLMYTPTTSLRRFLDQPLS